MTNKISHTNNFVHPTPRCSEETKRTPISLLSVTFVPYIIVSFKNDIGTCPASPFCFDLCDSHMSLPDMTVKFCDILSLSQVFIHYNYLPCHQSPHHFLDFHWAILEWNHWTSQRFCPRHHPLCLHLASLHQTSTRTFQRYQQTEFPKF
jgi:hypothetical protein